MQYIADLLMIVICISFVFIVNVFTRKELLADSSIDFNSINQRQILEIVDGVVSLNTYTLTFSTKSSDIGNSYRPIMRSINSKFGAEFSYSFWLNIGDASPAERVLFFKGVNKPATLQKYFKNVLNEETYHDPLVKCPLVRFGSYNELVVEFNTLEDITSKISIKPAESNIFDFLQGDKWAFLCMNLINDGNEIKLELFVNGKKYYSAAVKGTLKQNDGSLYVLPKSSGTASPAATSGTFGNLTYCNYALTESDVYLLYNKGIDDTKLYNFADELKNKISKPPYMSASNELVGLL